MLFTPGIAVSEARGSSGGITASRNRFGMYFRSRSVPVNPSSSYQQDVRNIFKALSAGYQVALTPLQRQAWDLYGDNTAWLNKLGQTVYLTGYNHFIRSNLIRLWGAIPAILDGPTTFGLPEGDATFGASASEATQLISVTFDDTADWCSTDGAAMFIQQSSPRPPSHLFIGPPYRMCGSILGSSETPPTSPQTKACSIPVSENQNLLVSSRISLDDGRLTTKMQRTFAVSA